MKIARFEFTIRGMPQQNADYLFIAVIQDRIDFHNRLHPDDLWVLTGGFVVEDENKDEDHEQQKQPPTV